MKVKCLGIAALLAASIVSFTSGAVCAASPVAVGYIPSGDFLPAFVAAEEGLFKQAGIDVQLVAVPLASNMPAALVANSAQIAMTTTPIMFQARENGIDLVAIAGLSWDLRSNPQVSILVRKDSGIKEASGLVGKKVAFPGLKSLFDSLALRWLSEKGVDPAKVTFLEGPMPQLADLLKSGNVDAISVLDPFREKAIAEGAVKLADFLVEMKDDQPLAYWMSLREYAQSHKTELDAFRKGIDAALVWIGQHPDEARKIGAKYLRGNIIAKFPNWKTTLTEQDMKFQTDLELKTGVLQKSPDLASAIVK